jgi:hypothetical protein
LAGFVELWGWSGAIRDRNANGHEILFLPGWRTQTQQPRWSPRSVAKLVRRIGRNIGRLAGPHNGFHATEGDLDLAFEHGKHLLEVVAVWRRAATGRDKHVNEAVATGGVLARHKDGIGVSRQSNVRQFLILVWARERQTSLKVIGWNGRGRGYHIYSGLLLGYWNLARATPNLLFSKPPVRLSKVRFLDFLKVVSYTFLTKPCIIQRTVGSFIKSGLAVEVNRHNSFAVNKQRQCMKDFGFG